MTSKQWREWRRTTSVLSPAFADNIIADLEVSERDRETAWENVGGLRQRAETAEADRAVLSHALKDANIHCALAEAERDALKAELKDFHDLWDALKIGTDDIPFDVGDKLAKIKVASDRIRARREKEEGK